MESSKARELFRRSFVALLRVSMFTIRRPLELKRKTRLCLAVQHYAIKSPCSKFSTPTLFTRLPLARNFSCCSHAATTHPFLCRHITVAPALRSTHCADTHGDDLCRRPLDCGWAVVGNRAAETRMEQCNGPRLHAVTPDTSRNPTSEHVLLLTCCIDSTRGRGCTSLDWSADRRV
jgi:hypothetical protein